MARPAGYVEKPLAERFDAKVFRSPDGCWLWTGFVDKAGYARLRAGGRDTPVLYAHRYSYERFVGPVPQGLLLDHLCRTRHCVNPAHLEAVTQRENVMRGAAPMVAVSLSGKCARGHERIPENTQYKRDGRVAFCKICRRERRRPGAR